MKVGYVAGKFAGANGWEVAQNVRCAEGVGFAVARAGAMPIIPHANTASFHGTLTNSFWYAGTLELLRRCDFIVMAPGWRASKGANDEYALARLRGICVFYATPVKEGESASDRAWTITSDNGGNLEDWLKENP